MKQRAPFKKIIIMDSLQNNFKNWLTKLNLEWMVFMPLINKWKAFDDDMLLSDVRQVYIESKNKNRKQKKLTIEIPEFIATIFPNLEGIDFRTCNEFVDDISVFKKNVNFSHLLLGTTTTKALEQIEELKDIEYIYFADTFLYTAAPKWLFLKINNLKKLKEMYIVGWDLDNSINDLLPLTEKKLEVFHIDFISGNQLEKNKLELRKLTNLTSIDLSYFTEFCTNFDFLLQFKKLTDVYFCQDDDIDLKLVRTLEETKIKLHRNPFR